MLDYITSLPRRPLIVLGLATLLLVVDDAIPDNAYFDADALAVILSVVVVLAAIAITTGVSLTWRGATHVAARAMSALLVSGVATGASLVAAEYATRWVFRDITTTSDDRGYFSNRWLSAAVTINSLGFREREFNAKPPGRYRIAVVGDSFTFGNGISADQRFSAHLQRALPSRAEVLNFGTAGANTPEHVGLIHDRLPTLTPDYVLVQWFVNDVEHTANSRPPVAHIVPSPAAHEWLLTSSASYTLLNTWWTRRQVLGQTATSYAGYMHARHADPQGEPARLEREAMRALVTVTGAIHARLGLVLFPDTSYDLGGDYPFEFLHRRVLDFCNEQKLTCLDLRPAFAGVKRRQSLWANPLDSHPSASANAIAAVKILETFEPEWAAAWR